jgi:hypothetical protein
LKDLSKITLLYPVSILRTISNDEAQLPDETPRRLIAQHRASQSHNTVPRHRASRSRSTAPQHRAASRRDIARPSETSKPTASRYRFKFVLIRNFIS